jgi:solute carrier family 13 (sodium-dependent dicarboxylate transporter), member 2/3/5
MMSKKTTKKIGLIAGPLLFLVFIFIPLPQTSELSLEAKIVLAATLWMALWWVTEAIPIYVTALLPLVLFPSLNVTPLGDTSASYADRVVFLFLGGFLLAKAVEKSNLHTRFALHILSVFGTNPKYIVAAFILVTGILSGWMSNTATAMLMLPIAAAVISQIHDKKHQKQFAVCILLSIAYSASIGGMATLIGTPPNAIFASLSKSTLDLDVSFGQWLATGLPISGISLFVLWIYITRIGVRITHIKSIVQESNLIKENLQKLGRLSRDEKLVGVIFAFTAIAWITRGLFWKDLLPMIDDSTIVVVAAISLFLLPSITASKKENIRHNEKEVVANEKKTLDDLESSNKETQDDDGKLLNWKTAVEIPWGVLLLIGGGLALANAFTTTGLDDWIASQLIFLSGMPLIVIILIIVAVAIFSSEVISNTAAAALLIPISASLATSLDINPILIMVPLTIATSYGFIMPVGTPPNAIVFATGHVTAAKMAKVGLPLDIIGILLVTVLTSILVPLLWT